MKDVNETLHRIKATWATPETVRTIGLFAAMAMGSYGIGNQTIGALNAAVGELRTEVRGVTAEMTAMRAALDSQDAAVRDLRNGTVNPSNISRIVAITAAVDAMDRDDSSHWTASGLPRISVIEKALKATGRRDYKVTSIERDHACALSARCRR